MLLLCYLLVVAVPLVMSVSDAVKPEIKIHGVDFANTNVEKVCMLATINATIELTQRLDNGTEKTYSSHIPKEATNEGSFCNQDFSSLLRMNFGANKVDLKFKRTDPAQGSTLTSYCDDCNYGIWHLSLLSINVTHDGYTVYGSTTKESIEKSERGLTDGIEISRSFRCSEEDKLIVLPLHVTKVTSSDGNATDTEKWKAEVKVVFIQLQPFMVFSENSFSDPYLCRDLTLGHVLIILVPLAYFVVFVAFYRIKHLYGCPPRRNRSRSSKGSMTQIEIEESTHMMSGEFDTLHLGESSCGYEAS